MEVAIWGRKGPFRDTPAVATGCAHLTDLLGNLRISWWTAGGSNSRPPRCERGGAKGLPEYFQRFVNRAVQKPWRSQCPVHSLRRRSSGKESRRGAGEWQFRREECPIRSVLHRTVSRLSAALRRSFPSSVSRPSWRPVRIPSKPPFYASVLQP